MITFAWPLILLIIPLFFVVFRFLPKAKKNQTAALKTPELSDFDCFKGKEFKSHLNYKFWLVFLTFSLIVLAAARPQRVGEAVQIPKTGRDLMLAVDLSDSMQVKDFELAGKYVDRLRALKVIAGDFIDKRKGDRIGLILFGTNAYVQAPLTFDGATVKQFLMEAEIGLAGGQTAMGDAMGLAIKQMAKDYEKNSVLILLTDGNNNAGELTPEKAAEIASHAKIKIHTIAIGSLNGTSHMFGFTPIDEKALQAISEKTGGQYFRAYNTKELSQIYSKINEIESVERESKHYLPIIEMYEWPLLIGLIGLGILMIL